MKWILMPFRRLTDVRGRSRRIEFWLFWLCALLLQMVAGYIDDASARSVIVAGMGPIALAITLALLVPASLVGIRRLHDIGRSGWWMLLFGFPYLGWLISMDSGSRGVIPAIALLIGTVVLLVLLVQPSQLGENAYGPNPKGGIADSENLH